jgi:hypothetical protein
VLVGNRQAGSNAGSVAALKSDPPPIESQDERTDEMGENKELHFRIWMALSTVAVYVFLVVTGNA